MPGSIKDRYRSLEDILKDDVTSVNKVYTLESYKKKDLTYVSPCGQEWESLLAVGKEQELVDRVHGYLTCLVEQDSVNMPILKALHIDMMQMIYTVLNQNQVSAEDLFIDEYFDSLRNHSLDSVAAMERFARHIIHVAVKYIRFAAESQSVVGRSKEFINSHLGEDISRASIAKAVFLNPDYLARLFKKETGCSLGAYIQEKRIDAAKRLLSQTNIPVNEIAERVGYDNVSYFSQVFREQTGSRPNEYRKGVTTTK